MDIQEIRTKLNMTQGEFAQFIGVSRMTVNRWENGKTKPLKIIQDRINELFTKDLIAKVRKTYPRSATEVRQDYIERAKRQKTNSDKPNKLVSGSNPKTKKDGD
ncbi:helix-turn-helix domain-containing protein [Patescibacteria group bacterium]|nr:helix-turn-helix domain-containing protein [Patescibacteria group bacterium]